MAEKRAGKQTVVFSTPPIIAATAAVVGPKEGQGPLAEYMDCILDDDMYGEKSFEKAETQIYLQAARLALAKAGVTPQDVDYLMGGDLLNQIITANFAARDLGIPFFGLYGACSTITESLSLGAMLIDGGYAERVLCVAASHFSTAERQYRYPLEQGTQRPPSAQWTVTGAGAVLLARTGTGPRVTMVTTGKVVDYGIKDANNMGAAMAPAAADTFQSHFIDTGRNPESYDMIVTGDLAMYGRELTIELLQQYGYHIEDRYIDCGCEIFDREKQDVHAGGSGCGCAAVVLSGYLMSLMQSRKVSRLLVAATGALLSPTSSMQGETIPGIAHAVAIESEG
jgi:stage V sporulation protein AD